MPHASNHDAAGLPRSAIVGGGRSAEHGVMRDLIGSDQAQILIRTAANRIRRGYLDGTLEPATANTVERALADLDRLGEAAADYADDAVRVGALQLVAARAAGGFQSAELQIDYAGAVLAAATIRGDRAAAPEAASAG